eukprot:6192604-Pleurochrysis_carterae.AAC.1
MQQHHPWRSAEKSTENSSCTSHELNEEISRNQENGARKHEEQRLGCACDRHRRRSRHGQATDVATWAGNLSADSAVQKALVTQSTGYVPHEETLGWRISARETICTVLDLSRARTARGPQHVSQSAAVAAVAAVTAAAIAAAAAVATAAATHKKRQLPAIDQDQLPNEYQHQCICSRASTKILASAPAAISKPFVAAIIII